MAMQDNVFQAVHNWDHAQAPSVWSRGEHTLATCTCGISLVGKTVLAHGKLDAIYPVGGDLLFCEVTGRDRRDVEPGKSVRSFRAAPSGILGARRSVA